MASIVTPKPCGCGLPSETRKFAETATFENLSWLVRRCPARCGICVIRRAMLGSIFAD